MKLILSGGGSGEQVKESYEIFSQNIKNGKVLYIPLAWNHGSYDGCLTWFKEEMKPFGIANIEMVTDANQITESRLQEVTGIFIGGGNTFKLLMMLKDTDAFNNIKAFMERNDGIIMGGSAGALIFGKDINTCLDDGLILKSCVDHNDVGLKDTSGFNCLNGFSILPHYKKLPEQYETFKIRISRLLENGYKLICIPEETSVIVEKNKFSIIGQRDAEIYSSKQQAVSISTKESFELI